MACIRTRVTKKNDERYHVMIRKKGIEICKSFSNKEDAELYTKWKENLIDLMDNFEVKISQTLTLEALFDMKLESIDKKNKRTLDDISNVKRITLENFPNKIFVSDISFEDWKNHAMSLYDRDVYVGAKSGRNIRKISLETLRKHFAYCSASFSHAMSLGIELDNHPLRVIQTFIRPLQEAKSISKE
jgi:hypothetical protein